MYLVPKDMYSRLVTRSNPLEQGELEKCKVVQSNFFEVKDNGKLFNNNIVPSKGPSMRKIGFQKQLNQTMEEGNETSVIKESPNSTSKNMQVSLSHDNPFRDITNNSENESTHEGPRNGKNILASIDGTIGEPILNSTRIGEDRVEEMEFTSDNEKNKEDIGVQTEQNKPSYSSIGVQSNQASANVGTQFSPSYSSKGEQISPSLATVGTQYEKTENDTNNDVSGANVTLMDIQKEARPTKENVTLSDLMNLTNTIEQQQQEQQQSNPKWLMKKSVHAHDLFSNYPYSLKRGLRTKKMKGYNMADKIVRKYKNIQQRKNKRKADLDLSKSPSKKSGRFERKFDPNESVVPKSKRFAKKFEDESGRFKRKYQPEKSIVEISKKQTEPPKKLSVIVNKENPNASFDASKKIKQKRQRNAIFIKKDWVS